jgi:hypothetical protein
LERRLAGYQGLGKGWLPAFPRLPPLSGFRAGRLLESPLAKRLESGSTKSVDSEDWVTLARASGLPMIKGPNFEPGATAKRFWNLKAWEAKLTFLMLQIALRERERGRLAKSPRAYSPPREPLHFASRLASADLSRQATRRAHSFFFGAIRVPVPNPTDKPNRCKLRQETQKSPWKPLYLVFFG